MTRWPVAHRWVWALCALLLNACAPRANPPPEAGLPETAPDYVIGPGDGLDIVVHLSPSLSVQSLPVRPDGRISLPLIPDIVASGKTPTRLSQDVAERLRRYVLEPNVSVIVRTFVGSPSQQIRVIGEATLPRSLPYREGMSVLDVVIEARGLTRYAAGNRAEIIRRGSNGEPPRTVHVRLDDLVRGGDIRQDMPMRPGDTLLIPQGWF